ncbi:MAG: sigma-70 family RNA polymerase sigma factor [Verrucomicrobiota bacterium]|nr:sigma-70 family RNA polymerase sigma factor [Verrucomicrobiota bacterium]
MNDDQQLLRRYADGSDAAFGELVARHVNLTYSVALRQTGGDAHRAKDISQLVFTDLARKARSIPSDVVLAGWLHRATLFAARQIVRSENRRHAREQEAVKMNAINSETSPDWEQISPMLDDALSSLGATDRDAILLRYFEQRSHAEIGATLGSNEDAARKRIARALEKLRGILLRRGISTTATVLSTVISANAVQAAPVGLATTLASASLAGATASAGATLTFMTMTKIKIGMISAIAIAGIATPLAIQHQSQVKLREENKSLRLQLDQLAQLTAENERLAKVVAQGNNSLTKDQLSELLKLRGEVGVLRRQNQQFEKLRVENEQRRGTTIAQNQAAQLPTEEEAKQISDNTVNALKLLGLAIRLYANDNKGQFATNFLQITNELPKTFPGGITLEAFEFAPHSQFVDETMPNMIIFREKNPRQLSNGKWERVYTFADGSAQKQQSDDGNFDAYEKEHSMTEEMIKNSTKR